MAELEAAGAPSVVRMRVPEGEIGVRRPGPRSGRFAGEHVPDYVIVRANGDPLYTLVNPVDDSLMEITHVLRGEDLLPSTPRQIVLYQALHAIGVGSGRTPRVRSPAERAGRGQPQAVQTRPGVRAWPSTSGWATCRRGCANYLALLGWAIADDRDVFTMAEMVEAFDIRRVNANPARFDAKKCEAINASHIRLLPTQELTERLVPFLVARRTGQRPAAARTSRPRLEAATPLVQERMNTLSEASTLLGLPVPDRRPSSRSRTRPV